MTMALRYEVKPLLNAKIYLLRSDITTLEVDAITNAANETLLGGGGVDGAIHRAAGPELLLECEKLNGCKTGSAKMTKGYNLPAKHVIHAVGPIGQKPSLLRGCYETSLNLAKEANLKSIAFPCISTGIFGYPNKAAAKVVLRTVREWLEKNEDSSLTKIVFCLFLPVDVRLYNTLKQMYFPDKESDVVPISDDEEVQIEEAEDENLDIDIVNEILSSDDSIMTAPTDTSELCALQSEITSEDNSCDNAVKKDKCKNVSEGAVQPLKHNKEDFGSSVDKDQIPTTDSVMKEQHDNAHGQESEKLQAAKRKKSSDEKDASFEENVPSKSESDKDSCAEPMDVPENSPKHEDKKVDVVILEEGDDNKTKP